MGPAPKLERFQVNQGDFKAALAVATCGLDEFSDAQWSCCRALSHKRVFAAEPIEITRFYACTTDAFGKWVKAVCCSIAVFFWGCLVFRCF